jgi:hypothetical protein
MSRAVFIAAVVIVVGLVLALATRAAAGGRDRAPGALVDAAILVTAGLTTLGLMGIAGAISYQHLLTLALEHGQRGWLGHAFPLSVDGVEIVASLRLLADQRIRVPSGWWPWAALVVGTGFSVFANVATAGPTLLDRVIAGWPAGAFLAAVKLLSGMLDRRTATTPAAVPQSAPVPAAAAPADIPATATNARAGGDTRTPHQPALDPTTAGTTQATDERGDEPIDQTATTVAAVRPVMQLPIDLMRRIPIHQDGYRRWQSQWADIQGDDVDLNKIATRHGVSRRHLSWVRAAGQGGWLDHPDPPAWRLAALGTHPTDGTNTQRYSDQPHNGQPYPDNPDDGSAPAGSTPEPQPVLTGQ